MESHPTNSPIDPPVHSPLIERVLDSLRAKIRGYVILHGLLLATIWLCGAFWVALLLDYGPVQLGFRELPRQARLLLLAVIAIGLGWLLYRWVFQPMQKQLSSASLAAVLERRFPELNDALATTVRIEGAHDDPSAAGDPDSQHQRQAMWRQVQSQAETVLDATPVFKVFNFRPMMTAGLTALALVFSVGWFGFTQQQAFSMAMRRLVLLDRQQWPRDCHLEWAGVKVKYDRSYASIPAMSEPREFEDDRLKVARSSNLSLIVRAETPDHGPPHRRLPRRCEMIYRTEDGRRGRLPMAKVGGAGDGFQAYAAEGDILEPLVDDIRFYVRGDDHTIGPFRIETVDPPMMATAQVECEFPDYLVDEASTRFTARKVNYTPGLKLPIGTRAAITVYFNQPVDRAWIVNRQGPKVQELEWTDTLCRIALDEVQEGIDFGVMVRAANGVYSPTALRFRVGAEADQPPSITSRLRGIGIAVTPNARIPIHAELRDDHGIQEAWIELENPVTETMVLSQPVQGELETEVDLRQLRASGQLPIELPTDSESQLVLTVAAQDYFNLDGGANVGTGTRHPLEIVSDGRLLRMLERDEADQRFRLEQIFREMTDARNYLTRSADSTAERQAGYEPGDERSADSTDSPMDDLDLRQLYVQRALLQVQKSTQEIESVAWTFDHIRQQLVHNRIDAEDRKRRLKNQVAEPLQKIHEVLLPDLERLLVDADQWYQQLPSAEDPESTAKELQETTAAALAGTDRVLAEIQKVLDSLLKFETQNELLDIVRRMLEEQKQIKARTEALRNREAFDDIFK